MELKRIYRALVRQTVRPLFGVFEALGVHVSPVHFYQPIPDTRSLPSSLWTRRSELVGIDMRLDYQLDLLKNLAAGYKSEYEALPREKQADPSTFYLRNGSFESVDAEIFYALLRHLKPARMIEIGSGNSTLIASAALTKNAADGNSACDYTVIDPFPRPVVQQGLAGVSRVVPQGVEDVELSTFDQLESGDILFIDSSHVVRIGGDVVYEYLEILPRLKPGVTIHIHDIFLPAEYPKNLIDKDRWFWSEQYLLQAFLAFNDSFEVVWAGNYLKLNKMDALTAAFSSFTPETSPGSFWIRRKA